MVAVARALRCWLTPCKAVLASAINPENTSRDTRRMMLQRRFKRMLIDVQDELHLLHLGEMEIWDGADLALLREALFKLIEHEHCRSIAIDMRFVKYIPSGFFGMLFDWHEKRGVTFSLTPPQPNVQQMLWFRRFFCLNSAGLFELHADPPTSMMPTNAESQDSLIATTA